MKHGTVKEYDRTKGFGFVSGDDGEDYFLHVSGLRQHVQQRGLPVGQRVVFDVDFGMRGDKAINVRPE
ncbi:MAG: cold shock domain-containing protein [Candidatus Marinimicrobia bacterium]|nr:cold shock domain-containing protein [Candidatus Neomarinimicrobiota bacterium]MBL7060190.1 cold shock domain-containing protein [Candidatus Neomarinimicrobiota bacterium]